MMLRMLAASGCYSLRLPRLLLLSALLLLLPFLLILRASARYCNLVFATTPAFAAGAGAAAPVAAASVGAAAAAADEQQPRNFRNNRLYNPQVPVMCQH